MDQQTRNQPSTFDLGATWGAGASLRTCVSQGLRFLLALESFNALPTLQSRTGQERLGQGWKWWWNCCSNKCAMHGAIDIDINPWVMDSVGTPSYAAGGKLEQQVEEPEPVQTADETVQSTSVFRGCHGDVSFLLHTFKSILHIFGSCLERLERERDEREWDSTTVKTVCSKLLLVLGRTFCVYFFVARNSELRPGEWL